MFPASLKKKSKICNSYFQLRPRFVRGFFDDAKKVSYEPTFLEFVEWF